MQIRKAAMESRVRFRDMGSSSAVAVARVSRSESFFFRYRIFCVFFYIWSSDLGLQISNRKKATKSLGSKTGFCKKRTASSSSLGSASGNPVEVKLETSGSLIDFDADIEPAPAAAVPQAQQTSVTQSYSQPVNSGSDNNWASFDFAPQVKVSQAPANANSLESLLSQLSVSAPVPSYVFGTVGNTGAFTAAGQMTAPFGGNSVITPVGHAMLPTATGSRIGNELVNIPPYWCSSDSPWVGSNIPSQS